MRMRIIEPQVLRLEHWKLVLAWFVNNTSSVQLLSRVWLFATSWTAVRQASLSFTNSQSLLRLMSIELVMPSNRLTLCLPLLPMASIVANIRVFPNESVVPIKWPKYWNFSFSISPYEYSGLVSFRIDSFDLLEVQGPLKSLEHQSSKTSILRCSAFFIVSNIMHNNITQHNTSHKQHNTY